MNCSLCSYWKKEENACGNENSKNYNISTTEFNECDSIKYRRTITSDTEGFIPTGCGVVELEDFSDFDDIASRNMDELGLDELTINVVIAEFNKETNEFEELSNDSYTYTNYIKAHPKADKPIKSRVEKRLVREAKHQH